MQLKKHSASCAKPRKPARPDHPQINKLAADSGVNKELEAQRTKLREQLKKTDDKLAVKAKRPEPAGFSEKIKRSVTASRFFP